MRDRGSPLTLLKQLTRGVSDRTRTPDTGGGTRWAQHQAPAVRMIEALTERGELVVDPFLGSGTFGLVAKSLGRRFIAAEVDADTYNQAVQRVAAT